MQRHPYFDLWLHSDEELSVLLGQPVRERVTLHEWPLSCVQRVDLAGGERLVYKAQVEEGVEAAFYARARSPLLTGCRDLGSYQGTHALALAWVNGARAADLRWSEAQTLAHGQRLVEAIQGLAVTAPGELPVYEELGTPGDWRAWVEATCATLESLAERGAFVISTRALAGRLADWSRSPEALAALRGPGVLSHADLNGGNIFVTGDGGYKLIDWQFPRRTAAGFDLALLLESRGWDPLRHLPPGVVKMVWMVRIGWFATCKARLFPPGETYDREVAALAARVLGG